jgi:ABC-2 type transport system ATP-binding protein
MSIVLELKKVAKSFDHSRVLSDVSLSVRKGEILGLIGPSGSGKSTLFRILLGYYSADGGKILFEGQDLSKNIRALRQKVGYTTQDDSFYPGLTVLENMRYYAHLYKVKKPDLNAHLLSIIESVELSNAQNTVVQFLSGGMRRRLNFAISLIHDPDILVLDEPTTGLDPLLVEQFWTVVHAVVKKKKTAIVTSHIFSELENHCTRIAIMHKGKIALETTPKSLLKKFRKFA